MAGAYGVPYRTLLPAGIDGLLVAGRCIAVDAVAFGSTRNIPVCAMTGEVAGIAAALAARQGKPPRQVESAAIRAQVQARGLPL